MNQRHGGPLGSIAVVAPLVVPPFGLEVLEMFRTPLPSDGLFRDPPGPCLLAICLAAILVLAGCSSPGGDTGTEIAESGFRSAVPSDRAAVGGDPSESPMPSHAPTPAAADYKRATADGPAENVPLPVMPELAKHESKEGLEAFVRYWFALINYGYETGDVEAVRATSGTSCKHCEGYFGAIEKGYKGADWIVGGTLDLRGVGTEFIKTPENRYQAIVSVAELPSVYRGTGGVVYGEKPGSKYSFAQIVEASYLDGAWMVELVDNLG